MPYPRISIVEHQVQVVPVRYYDNFAVGVLQAAIWIVVLAAFVIYAAVEFGIFLYRRTLVPQGRHHYR